MKCILSCALILQASCVFVWFMPWWDAMHHLAFTTTLCTMCWGATYAAPSGGFIFCVWRSVWNFNRQRCCVWLNFTSCTGCKSSCYPWLCHSATSRCMLRCLAVGAATVHEACPSHQKRYHMVKDSAPGRHIKGVHWKCCKCNFNRDTSINLTTGLVRVPVLCQHNAIEGEGIRCKRKSNVVILMTWVGATTCQSGQIRQIAKNGLQKSCYAIVALHVGLRYLRMNMMESSSIFK